MKTTFELFRIKKQSLQERFKSSIKARRAFSRKDLPPILIYSMGKVGSSTVYTSLLKSQIPNPVLHVHFISEELKEHTKTHIEAGILPLPSHLYLGAAIQKLFREQGVLPCKIISLVRDPVAFVVSNLFENPDFSSWSVYETSNDCGSNKKICPTKASKYLNKIICEKSAFNYVNDWFDKEIKAVFGIDVFDKPFHKENGFCTYTNSFSQVSLLLIRLEDLTQNGPAAITNFLEMDSPLVLKSTNLRKKQSYRETINNIHIDSSILKEIYAERLTTHLYGNSMIQKFTKKWV